MARKTHKEPGGEAKWMKYMVVSEKSSAPFILGLVSKLNAISFFSAKQKWEAMNKHEKKYDSD